MAVHPVSVTQGRENLGRVLTDRLGKFKLDFNYTPGTPLLIQTGSTSSYLSAQGNVEPDSEVSINVMPRWATILGIVTDRDTGRGVAGIPVQIGRGDKAVVESWALGETDATGVYMLKVPAFEGDDVTKPIRDYWLAINEGENANLAYAQIRTAALPIWAWSDPTQPTKVEISLPNAKASGLKLADVVTVSAPAEMKVTAPAPAPATTEATTNEPALTTVAMPMECIIMCPHCGKPIKVILQPAN